MFVPRRSDYICSPFRPGEVLEWLNRTVSKTVEPFCGSVSSNLTLSAKQEGMPPRASLLVLRGGRFNSPLSSTRRRVAPEGCKRRSRAAHLTLSANDRRDSLKGGPFCRFPGWPIQLTLEFAPVPRGTSHPLISRFREVGSTGIDHARSAVASAAAPDGSPLHRSNPAIFSESHRAT